MVCDIIVKISDTFECAQWIDSWLPFFTQRYHKQPFLTRFIRADVRYGAVGPVCYWLTYCKIHKHEGPCCPVKRRNLITKWSFQSFKNSDFSALLIIPCLGNWIVFDPIWFPTFSPLRDRRLICIKWRAPDNKPAHFLSNSVNSWGDNDNEPSCLAYVLVTLAALTLFSFRNTTCLFTCIFIDMTELGTKTEHSIAMSHKVLGMKPKYHMITKAQIMKHRQMFYGVTITGNIWEMKAGMCVLVMQCWHLQMQLPPKRMM